jgi:hypothetical protein
MDMACSDIVGEADLEPCFFNIDDLRIPGGQPLPVPGTVGAATVGVRGRLDSVRLHLTEYFLKPWRVQYFSGRHRAGMMRHAHTKVRPSGNREAL